MAMSPHGQKDAYSLILEAIDVGVYRPGDRLVESELAERFGVSGPPSARRYSGSRRSRCWRATGAA